MKASQLKGQAVVTLSDAVKVGHIDDILFDAQYRRVLGFQVKKALLGQGEAVLRGSVTALGSDAVTVPSPEVINLQDRFDELSGAATLGQAHGTKVVTEGGTLLGTIDDVELDDQAQEVTAYVLGVALWNRLLHGEPKIPASDVLRLGEGRLMIVADSAEHVLHPSKDNT